MNLIDLFVRHGPLTGKEIIEKTAGDIYDTWLACNMDDRIFTQTIGNRYLRLDKYVSGYARLSPSIMREFYNYSVVGLAEQMQEIQTKAEKIHQDIKRISREKHMLAKEIMEDIIASQEDSEVIREKACFIIAGDVACGMAHSEPRPEFSTGKMVNGSDLDIVVIHAGLPEDTVKSLDASIYEKKYFYLMNPLYREEIDYVIKDIAKVEKQLRFDCFETMVACKVLHEGVCLCGSHELFSEIKRMVACCGIPDKLAMLTHKAHINRLTAIGILLKSHDAIRDEEMKHLFYTTHEREEFY
ncbi:MAG TPA: hypothetical protein PLZ84_00560 [Clostridia bacterium]|nr:hypothetical protein [Clostridia bacterium]